VRSRFHRWLNVLSTRGWGSDVWSMGRTLVPVEVLRGSPVLGLTLQVGVQEEVVRSHLDRSFTTRMLVIAWQYTGECTERSESVEHGAATEQRLGSSTSIESQSQSDTTSSSTGDTLRN